MNIFQKELLGLHHKQQVLGILVFSLVTVILWVGISLITSQTKTSISPALIKLARPLSPTLNIEVIDTLEQKRVYDQAELTGFPIYRTITPERAAVTPPSSNPLNTLNATTLESELPVDTGIEGSGDQQILAEPAPETGLPAADLISTDSAKTIQ